MKIAITGASGFVGRQLIPKLLQRGATLLLIGRDPVKLKNLFPECQAASYSDWQINGRGWDALVHLAALNNDAPHTDEEYRRVNVDLTMLLAEQAADCGISRFINISSVHALDDTNTTGYADSKREAVRKLAAASITRVTTLYLPLVYGDSWGGQLEFLNRLPKTLSGLIFRPLAAIKPTVHVDLLAEYLLRDQSSAEDTVLSDGQEHNCYYKTANAIINWGFAISIALFFWWAMLIIWILIRLESKGPGIFAQERIGQGGEPFICYKFRTMQMGTVQAGSHEVSQASITRVGAFLRKTKLDELPQIWNIFLGEIQLVGPRPGLPVQKELFQARDSRKVFEVKPGITGWAQIHEVDMSTPDKLAMWDAQYISLRCLFLDLKIILSTAFGRGQGDRTKSE